MAWFAILLAHVLVLFLIIAVPFRGAQRYRVLMRRIDRHPELRARFYVNGILAQWLMLLPLALIAIGLSWPLGTLGLQPPTNLWLWGSVALLLVLVVYAQVFYIRRIASTVDGRSQLRKSMSGPLHMLPRTQRERSLWVLLSLTAGICEEVLYRGFLPAYLVHIFPDVPFVLAIVIAAALFGLGHIYQKITGVVGTGVMGLLFGFLYFFTGSLFLPMIVHALFDMRLLFIDVPGIVDAPEPAPAPEAVAEQPS
jgi:membrane protease YdiL (CAAX protease family)